jgi:glycosyltransferase involved in cell wall biosynthesis
MAGSDPIIDAFFNRFLVKLWPFHVLALTNMMIARPQPEIDPNYKPLVSVVVPARNEAGNIVNILERVPDMGGGTEIVFVEGNSTDDTFETIKREVAARPEKNCQILQQTGKGKGDAVRLGYREAKGDIFMILDADLTVPPEDLPRFYDAITQVKVTLSTASAWYTPWKNRRCVSLTCWVINFSHWLSPGFLVNR